MKNNYLSPWAKNVSPSPTLAVDAKAKAQKAAGEDVCGFGAGEPDFDTPAFIKDACAKALAEGKTKYAPATTSISITNTVMAGERVLGWQIFLLFGYPGHMRTRR